MLHSAAVRLKIFSAANCAHKIPLNLSHYIILFVKNQ